MTDHVDSTATEEPGGELVHVDQPPTTLFRTDDPVEVVARATQVADALKGVLERQGLTSNIGGKQHVRVEGWTTLGAMVGVTAIPVWTRPLDGTAPQGKTFGFEARVEARTLDGRVIGAADAMCTRNEGRWSKADDYAIRSMAQTRATSKALRGPLGFVVTLAGYEATPAEEIPTEESRPPASARCSQEQYREILKAFSAAQRRGLKHDAFLDHLDLIGAPENDVIGNRIGGLLAEEAAELQGWLERFDAQEANAA